MGLINVVVGVPLGYAIGFIYGVVHNYGVAIIIFTIISRLITIPMAYRQQKSLVRTNALKPYIDEINKKYAKSKNFTKKNE